MILIFANGDLHSVDWINPYLSQAVTTIAVDGGLRYLQALGYWPDILIGDLDSIPDDTKAEIEESGIQIMSYPRDKDKTDLELALLIAAEKFSGQLVVIGAFGGRLDQMLANIFLLAHPDLVDRDILLVSEHQRAWLVRDYTIVMGVPGDLVSLIPLEKQAEIEKTTGLKWPLYNEVLDFGKARGISNVMIDKRAEIRIKNGVLLCVHTAGEWKR